MSIRIKLLLLLLAISVIPLLVHSWYSWSVTGELGETLSERSRQSEENALTEQLRQLIHYNARLVEQQKKLMELAVHLQVRAVEQRLRKTPVDAPEVYSAARFDDPGQAPSGLAISAKHQRRQADGSLSPMAVSYEHQVIWVVAGSNEARVQRDVRRLADMTAVYHALTQEHPYLFHWQYTALDSGVHSSFPGHGGFPEDYDPRRRDWYQRAINAGERVWNPPIVDATTRQVMLTLSAPVRDADGFMAGVTAIDVPIMSLLGDARARTTVSDRIDTLLVHFATGPANPDGAVLAMAYEDYVEANLDWRTPIKPHALGSSDRAGFRRLTADLAASRGGVQRMPYQGRDALWVYGPVDRQGNFLFYTVPYEDVVAEIERSRLQIQDATRDQIRAALGLLAAIAAALVLVALISARAVTEPIRQLADAAHRLASGDFSQTVEASGHDELAQLKRTFNRMVRKLKERMAMRQALALAREVQQNLLPQHPPEIEGLDIGGCSRYCDETGGDYYDYLDLSDHEPRRVNIALGDISGHGFSSALLMTTARALLRAQSGQGFPLADQLALVNRHLCADAKGSRFMTLFYLSYELDQGLLRWINAGHGPALRYHPEQDRFAELSGDDIPLGVDPTWQYQECRLEDWAPGEWIVLFTDGVTEARNRNGEMFGMTRLMDCIREQGTAGAGELCGSIITAVDRFREGEPQGDDITLVAIRRLAD